MGDTLNETLRAHLLEKNYEDANEDMPAVEDKDKKSKDKGDDKSEDKDKKKKGKGKSKVKSDNKDAKKPDEVDLEPETKDDGTVTNEETLNEGPFSRVGKYMMKRRLKKGIKKDNTDMDDVLDDDDMDDHDDDSDDGGRFAKAYDSRSRKQKALKRLSKKRKIAKEEALDELSTEKLLKYRKAARKASSKVPSGVNHPNIRKAIKHDVYADDADERIKKKTGKYNPGVLDRVKAKLRKEEAIEAYCDQITLDELSKKTLGSYVKKATKAVGDRSYLSGDLASKGYKDTSKRVMKNLKGRKKGIVKAVDKLTKEEYINEDTVRVRRKGEEKTVSASFWFSPNSKGMKQDGWKKG